MKISTLFFLENLNTASRQKKFIASYFYPN